MQGPWIYLGRAPISTFPSGQLELEKKEKRSFDALENTDRPRAQRLDNILKS